MLGQFTLSTQLLGAESGSGWLSGQAGSLPMDLHTAPGMGGYNQEISPPDHAFGPVRSPEIIQQQPSLLWRGTIPSYVVSESPVTTPRVLVIDRRQTGIVDNRQRRSIPTRTTAKTSPKTMAVSRPEGSSSTSPLTATPRLALAVGAAGIVFHMEQGSSSWRSTPQRSRSVLAAAGTLFALTAHAAGTHAKVDSAHVYHLFMFLGNHPEWTLAGAAALFGLAGYGLYRGGKRLFAKAPKVIETGEKHRVQQTTTAPQSPAPAIEAAPAPATDYDFWLDIPAPVAEAASAPVAEAASAPVAEAASAPVAEAASAPATETVETVVQEKLTGATTLAKGTVARPNWRQRFSMAVLAVFGDTATLMTASANHIARRPLPRLTETSTLRDISQALSEAQVVTHARVSLSSDGASTEGTLRRSANALALQADLAQAQESINLYLANDATYTVALRRDGLAEIETALQRVQAAAAAMSTDSEGGDSQSDQQNAWSQEIETFVQAANTVLERTRAQCLPTTDFQGASFDRHIAGFNVETGILFLNGAPPQELVLHDFPPQGVVQRHLGMARVIFFDQTDSRPEGIEIAYGKPSGHITITQNPDGNLTIEASVFGKLRFTSRVTLSSEDITAQGLAQAIQGQQIVLRDRLLASSTSSETGHIPSRPQGQVAIQGPMSAVIDQVSLAEGLVHRPGQANENTATLPMNDTGLDGDNEHLNGILGGLAGVVQTESSLGFEYGHGARIAIQHISGRNGTSRYQVRLTNQYGLDQTISGEDGRGLVAGETPSAVVSARAALLTSANNMRPIEFAGTPLGRAITSFDPTTRTLSFVEGDDLIIGATTSFEYDRYHSDRVVLRLGTGTVTISVQAVGSSNTFFNIEGDILPEGLGFRIRESQQYLVSNAVGTATAQIYRYLIQAESQDANQTTIGAGFSFQAMATRGELVFSDEQRLKIEGLHLGVPALPRVQMENGTLRLRIHFPDTGLHLVVTCSASGDYHYSLLETTGLQSAIYIGTPRRPMEGGLADVHLLNHAIAELDLFSKIRQVFLTTITAQINLQDSNPHDGAVPSAAECEALKELDDSITLATNMGYQVCKETAIFYRSRIEAGYPCLSQLRRARLEADTYDKDPSSLTLDRAKAWQRLLSNTLINALCSQGAIESQGVTFSRNPAHFRLFIDPLARRWDAIVKDLERQERQGGQKRHVIGAGAPDDMATRQTLTDDEGPMVMNEAPGTPAEVAQDEQAPQLSVAFTAPATVDDDDIADGDLEDAEDEFAGPVAIIEIPGGRITAGLWDAIQRPVDDEDGLKTQVRAPATQAAIGGADTHSSALVFELHPQTQVALPQAAPDEAMITGADVFRFGFGVWRTITWPVRFSGTVMHRVWLGAGELWGDLRAAKQAFDTSRGNKRVHEVPLAPVSTQSKPARGSRAVRNDLPLYRIQDGTTQFRNGSTIQIGLSGPTFEMGLYDPALHAFVTDHFQDLLTAGERETIQQRVHGAYRRFIALTMGDRYDRLTTDPHRRVPVQDGNITTQQILQGGYLRNPEAGMFIFVAILNAMGIEARIAERRSEETPVIIYQMRDGDNWGVIDHMRNMGAYASGTTIGEYTPTPTVPQTQQNRDLFITDGFQRMRYRY